MISVPAGTGDVCFAYDIPFGDDILLRRMKERISYPHRYIIDRELQLSLGNYDHLYINFTPLLEVNEIQPAEKSTDRHHPWFRFYDVGVKQDLLKNINAPEN